MIDLFMKLLAAALFPISFEYFYFDDPGYCKPPGALGDPKPISSICSISTPVGKQIPEYLKSGLFK
jgi:hypothetical protein